MSYEQKLIYDYAGLTFSEQEEIDCLSYWQLLKDAIVYNASATEEGRDWLDRCYVASQTEPDRATLRRLFGGGSNGK